MSRPLTPLRATEQSTDVKDAVFRAAVWVVVQQRQLGCFNHMRIEHRQERSNGSKALIAEGHPCHDQRTEAVLDGHLPDAGDRHQAWPGSQQRTGCRSQPRIVKVPSQHHLGVEQQAHQLLNSSAIC